ncbi:chymotrypsin B-like [Brachionus plicatilis]|uniref:Chymotrypsin B-like n=1 Tax=Brachionus plicatilis TaxID=10195 RepID=A0A3M7SB42_BRAPC|nr:chymotrypsin B-like [Brachionus plicatilis]
MYLFEQRHRPDTEVTASSWSSTPYYYPVETGIAEWFVFFFLATFQHIFACGSGSFKIINGEEASVWPWMVSLQSVNQNRHFCGGSFYIKAGTNNLNEANITTYQVSRVTIHENYNSRSLDNDIALIKLTEPITESSKISTICLPSSTDEKTIIDQQVYTAGW